MSQFRFKENSQKLIFAQKCPLHSVSEIKGIEYFSLKIQINLFQPLFTISEHSVNPGPKCVPFTPFRHNNNFL